MDYKYLYFVIICLGIISVSCDSVDIKDVNMEKEMQSGSNKVLEVIHERKSVRNYTDSKVSLDTLQILVRAGMAAPSAKNVQAWAFVIVNEKYLLEKMGDELANARMLKNAPAAIVVCGDITKASLDVDSTYWVHECAAATQNILLAAESMGLGAVWTASFPYKDRVEVLRKYLNIPMHLVPLNIIPIGYPYGNEKAQDKFKEENVYYNAF